MGFPSSHEFLVKKSPNIPTIKRRQTEWTLPPKTDERAKGKENYGVDGVWEQVGSVTRALKKVHITLIRQKEPIVARPRVHHFRQRGRSAAVIDRHEIHDVNALSLISEVSISH